MCKQCGLCGEWAGGHLLSFQTHVMSTNSGPVPRPSGRMHSLVKESRAAAPLSRVDAACRRVAGEHGTGMAQLNEGGVHGEGR